jgi:hypothetical protein
LTNFWSRTPSKQKQIFWRNVMNPTRENERPVPPPPPVLNVAREKEEQLQREQASKAEQSHQNSGGVDVSTIVKDAAPIVEGIIAAL